RANGAPAAGSCRVTVHADPRDVVPGPHCTTPKPLPRRSPIASASLLPTTFGAASRAGPVADAAGVGAGASTRGKEAKNTRSATSTATMASRATVVSRRGNDPRRYVRGRGAY